MAEAPKNQARSCQNTVNLKKYEACHAICAWQGGRMPHCGINDALQYMVVSWEEPHQGTKAMSTRFRPIHSGFETLRIAGLSAHSSQGYHHFGSATNEQITSRGMGRLGSITRPAAVFADFRER
jgi:hypothetical protein